MHEWHVYADKQHTALACAEYLFHQIKNIIHEQGVCHIALPGGTTPAACFESLASRELPWDLIHWYLGDERCYPLQHEDRNDTMIQRSLWSKISATPANIHLIHTELGAEVAAADYLQLISTLDRLDLVLLGMGEDGHTASLFPDNPALLDDRLVVPVHDSPKLPADRVSLGRRALGAARQRIVLATGRDKHEAITKVRKGIALPVNILGDCTWFVDEAAFKGV